MDRDQIAVAAQEIAHEIMTACADLAPEMALDASDAVMTRALCVLKPRDRDRVGVAVDKILAAHVGI